MQYRDNYLSPSIPHPHSTVSIPNPVPTDLDSIRKESFFCVPASVLKVNCKQIIVVNQLTKLEYLNFEIIQLIFNSKYHQCTLESLGYVLKRYIHLFSTTVTAALPWTKTPCVVITVDPHPFDYHGIYFN